MLHQKIIAADASQLRPTVWSDWVESPAEAEQLFALKLAADPQDHDWNAFFVEAMAGYLLSRGDPRGFVSDADATWLLGQFRRDDRIATATQRDVLDRLRDRAEQLPAVLGDYRRQLDN